MTCRLHPLAMTVREGVATGAGGTGVMGTGAVEEGAGAALASTPLTTSRQKTLQNSEYRARVDVTLMSCLPQRHVIGLKFLCAACTAHVFDSVGHGCWEPCNLASTTNGKTRAAQYLTVLMHHTHTSHAPRSRRLKRIQLWEDNVNPLWRNTPSPPPGARKDDAPLPDRCVGPGASLTGLQAWAAG